MDAEDNEVTQSERQRRIAELQAELTELEAAEAAEIEDTIEEIVEETADQIEEATMEVAEDLGATSAADHEAIAAIVTARVLEELDNRTVDAAVTETIVEDNAEAAAEAPDTPPTRTHFSERRIW